MLNIPEVLKTLSGVTVESVDTWKNYRREEIMALCCQYVYGNRDIERPDNLFFDIVKEDFEYGMKVKHIEGGFDDFKFPFRVYFPENVSKPVPVIVYVMHENAENNMAYNEEGNMFWGDKITCLPLKYVTDRGYAVAVMPTRQIYREWSVHADFKVGVFAAVKNQKPRNKNSWASISSWAWGVSRVVDYLETDAEIDSARIGVTGHSRSGKAALWAGATDERIFLTAPNNSGCMGAAILRGKRGEHAKEINISDWFCEKFKEYNDCEELLPIDQHFVLSLVAPRYLYVSDSILDEWADPDAELLAAKLSTPVYELYGKKGLVMSDATPVLNKAYHDGCIAFHVKEGDHSQTMFDWEKLLDYFDKIK